MYDQRIDRQHAAFQHKQRIDIQLQQFVAVGIAIFGNRNDRVDQRLAITAGAAAKTVHQSHDPQLTQRSLNIITCDRQQQCGSVFDQFDKDTA